MSGREDANRLALRVVRTILDGATDLTLYIDGFATEVRIERLPQAPAPAMGRLEGLDDGPWPRAVQASCSSLAGKRTLIVQADYFRASGRYRNFVSLRVSPAGSSQQLVWITLPPQLDDAVDGTETPISATFSLFKQKGNVAAGAPDALKAAVARSKLPLLSSSKIEAFRVHLPEVEVLPSPSEAFRRLVHLALLKFPFLVQPGTGVEGKLVPVLHSPEVELRESELDDEEAEEAPEVANPELHQDETEPSRWLADRLELTAFLVQPHLGQLELPAGVIERACAALAAGKHLLLVGPPGTGKTELAHVLANAARAEDYCRGLFEATASADWTTYETIGGYALERDQSLRFRPGAFLRAVESWKWLLVDELNRADVDKAFGELMTVLAGRGTDTPFELKEGQQVSIGFEAWRTHRLSKTFRVIATMNTWDKTSLFRLSYAVQRRFAVIHLGIPGDEAYERLLDRIATEPSPAPPLDEATVRRLKLLFQRQGLLAYRDIGPAIVLDIVRYMRQRAAAGDGLAEALTMFLLPQLEGLDQERARKVYALFVSTLTGWTSDDAMQELYSRCEEVWPPGSLPGA